MWEALFTVALAAFVCFSAAAVMLGTEFWQPVVRGSVTYFAVRRTTTIADEVIE